MVAMETMLPVLILFISVPVYCGVIKEPYKLDIIHYNDFHDRIEETSFKKQVCDTNNTECIGGFSRFYNAIQMLLKDKPQSLLLNAGDIYQGTYWYNQLKWEVLKKLFNLLPNNSHTLGNHEFDDGVEGLVPFITGLQGTVVVANIDTRKEPSLRGLYKPHVVVERGGRKIGIIGIITSKTNILSNPDEVIFLDPIDTVKREAEVLKNDGVDIIIVLSHCGLDVEKEIAETVGENIDIIVGGHSHSFLWNGPPLNNNLNVSGPYPIVIEPTSKPGHKVLIVTAACCTYYLGNLTIYFDEAGEVQSFVGDPIFLNRSIVEDPQINSIIQPYKEKLHNLISEIIGVTEDDLRASICGYQECVLGNLITDSFMSAASKTVNTTLPQVGFFVKSMIRGPIYKGEISRGDIINILPFSNKIMTFVANGSYLWETFEKSLENCCQEEPFEILNMMQVSGLKVTLNTTSRKPELILVKHNNDFVPLELDREYQISAPMFIIKGGDGFKNVKHTAHNLTLIGRDAPLLENQIKKLTPIKVVLDNRITLVR